MQVRDCVRPSEGFFGEEGEADVPPRRTRCCVPAWRDRREQCTHGALTTTPPLATRKNTHAHTHTDAKAKWDEEVTAAPGVTVLIDPGALMHVVGTVMDYRDDGVAAAFSFANPNAAAACGCGESFTSAAESFASAGKGGAGGGGGGGGGAAAAEG
jgi:hypothetical protein